MVNKSKQKNARKNKNRQTSKRVVRASRALQALDQKALDYARLLCDPCNAAMVNPVYPGGDSGFLFRAESFVTVGNAALATAGVMHWTPGYINFNDTELLAFGSANGTTTSPFSTIPTCPGKTFLADNARAYRCVAACMKITYPGQESLRSGRVQYGHTSSGMLDASATTVYPDGVAQTLQHYTRCPAETIELKWYPGVGDFEFNDPSETSSAFLRDRKTALTCSWAGLPAGVGMTFHLTAVYEWRPAVARGVGHNALGKNRSKNTFDQVMDFLLENGETFVKHAATAAGTVGANALISTISQQFGIMSAQGATRRIAFR